MDIAKLQQNIKEAEEALSRMKEELKKAEKAQEVDSKDFYPKSQRIHFNVDTILKVIDNKGYVHLLYIAFDWDETPEGSAYWEDRANGVTPFSDEDKITLLRWCVNYYRSKKS